MANTPSTSILPTNVGLGEGFSYTRPPMFDGINFSYWKQRMRVFLSSLDYDVMLSVFEGYISPTIEDENKVKVPKAHKDYSTEERKLA